MLAAQVQQERQLPRRERPSSRVQPPVRRGPNGCTAASWRKPFCDPSMTLVDALLARSNLAKELGAQGIERLQAREAALHDEELDLKAHKIYHSAYDRVRHARSQSAGQDALQGAFMVAAVQCDPGTTLLDVLLAQSAVAKGIRDCKGIFFPNCLLEALARVCMFLRWRLAQAA